jgi:hypothetical protein
MLSPAVTKLITALVVSTLLIGLTLWLAAAATQTVA